MSKHRVEFMGEILDLNDHQFNQALADSKLCRCGECLACKVRQITEESIETLNRKTRQLPSEEKR